VIVLHYPVSLKDAAHDPIGRAISSNDPEVQGGTVQDDPDLRSFSSRGAFRRFLLAEVGDRGRFLPESLRENAIQSQDLGLGPGQAEGLSLRGVDLLGDQRGDAEKRKDQEEAGGSPHEGLLNEGDDRDAYSTLPSDDTDSAASVRPERPR
jgi:hypothetical protein